MSSFSYRPPWPDELPRVAALLPQGQAPGPGWHPRAWEARRPTRFVGAAGWKMAQASRRAQVFFHFQPRYATALSAPELLRPLFAEIAATGAAEARVTLAGREPWEKILGAFGLAWERADEFWSVDVAAARARLANSALRARAGGRRGWGVRPLRDEDWELVRRWAVERRFLPQERWEQLRAHHAADFSGIAEREGRACGLLVATAHGFTGVLEFLGGDPASPRDWPVAAHLLLSRLAGIEAPAAPFDEVMMTADPARGGAARALARRFGMRRTGVAHHFAGRLRALAE